METSLEPLDFLKEQDVSERLLRAVADFRATHAVPQDAAARVPAPATHYLGREVWEAAIAAVLCGENLLLAGPKATGKNVLAEDLASVFGRPAWNVSFHIDVDASFLIGTDTYRDGQVEFRPGPVTLAAREGGFCVLDEVNMARSEALAVLHAALDFRRIIDIPGYELERLDEATRFVATMNVGYVGTRELNEALTSRFAVLSLPVLREDELELLLRQEFGDLKPKAARQLARLFDEIRLKCQAGQISDKALDLRGLTDAIRLASLGIPLTRALEMCIVNKTFDDYERGLVRDVIDARLPRKLESDALFE